MYKHFTTLKMQKHSPNNYFKKNTIYLYRDYFRLLDIFHLTNNF